MIIFLYGEDAFRSSQKIKEIKEKFLKSDPIASGLSVFPARNASRLGRDAGGDYDGIIGVLSTPNLLASKRLVIIKRLLSKGTSEEQEKLLEYLEKNKKNLTEDKDLVVVFWEEETAKKNNALFKFLESRQGGAKSQELKKLSGIKLDQWINERLREINPRNKISASALQKLVLYAGSDMFLLDNEIQKLANYANGQMISDEDVEILVKANLDSNIFNTIDALGAKNKKEALKLLHRHLGQGEDPFYILSMFIYQFRNLLKVADLNLNEGRSEQEIAKISKLHPYVVKKSLAQIQRFSFQQLKKIYQKLGEMDLKIKTGQLDIKLALDKFVVEL